MSGSILVVYYYRTDAKLNSTYRELLYCFKNHFPYEVFHLNLAYRIPGYLLREKFSAILIHHTVLAEIRWSPKRYGGIASKISTLCSRSDHLAAFAQDEYFRLDLIDQLLQDLNVEKFFTVTPRSVWKDLYPGLSQEKMEEVLTGYIDEQTVNDVNSIREKPVIDIGYRATYPGGVLGGFGKLKSEIGHVFLNHSKQYGLKTDIAIVGKENLGKLFYGLDWFRFLKRCKYTLGVESGYSYFNGSNDIDVRTISPRHFEGCIAKTCQVLIEGEYSGILKPYKHYIPVKRDFSNIDEVLTLISKDEVRMEIVERAYHDIVESQKYHYDVFIEKVLKKTLSETERGRLKKRTRLSYFDYLRGLYQFKRSTLEMKIYRSLNAWVPVKQIYSRISL